MIIELITRLRSQCPAFVKIEPWLDTDSQEVFPVLSVQMTDDDSTQTEGLNSSLQRRIVEFSLMIGAKQHDMVTDYLQAARDEVNAALQGWILAGYTPFQHGSGTIIHSDAYNIWWQDRYSTSYLSKG